MLILEALGRPGLHPVDLTLAAGERAVVMGPSGAGKSLLLRAIADLDPNDGEVILDGTRRATLPAPLWRRRVGYLAAEPGWWSDRPRDHLPDTRETHGMCDALALPAAIMDRPVARLSTGERQRLALIRLLLNGPRVLLLDEPTSGLDPESTARVEALLDARRADGAITLMVSHDPAQAARLATRRLTIRDGRLETAA